ncbi:MAG: hypothetical protein WCE21_00900 [Candidatus Babeliales bacterium]
MTKLFFFIFFFLVPLGALSMDIDNNKNKSAFTFICTNGTVQLNTQEYERLKRRVEYFRNLEEYAWIGTDDQLKSDMTRDLNVDQKPGYSTEEIEEVLHILDVINKKGRWNKFIKRSISIVKYVYNIFLSKSEDVNPTAFTDCRYNILDYWGVDTSQIQAAVQKDKDGKDILHILPGYTVIWRDPVDTPDSVHRLFSSAHSKKIPLWMRNSFIQELKTQNKKYAWRISRVSIADASITNADWLPKLLHEMDISGSVVIERCNLKTPLSALLQQECKIKECIGVLTNNEKPVLTLDVITTLSTEHTIDGKKKLVLRSGLFTTQLLSLMAKQYSAYEVAAINSRCSRLDWDAFVQLPVPAYLTNCSIDAFKVGLKEIMLSKKPVLFNSIQKVDSGSALVPYQLCMRDMGISSSQQLMQLASVMPYKSYLHFDNCSFDNFELTDIAKMQLVGRFFKINHCFVKSITNNGMVLAVPKTGSDSLRLSYEYRRPHNMKDFFKIADAHLIHTQLLPALHTLSEQFQGVEIDHSSIDVLNVRDIQALNARNITFTNSSIKELARQKLFSYPIQWKPLQKRTIYFDKKTILTNNTDRAVKEIKKEIEYIPAWQRLKHACAVYAAPTAFFNAVSCGFSLATGLCALKARQSLQQQNGGLAPVYIGSALVCAGLSIESAQLCSYGVRGCINAYKNTHGANRVVYNGS